jgi:uncharacterized protein (DUF1501 family)
MDRRQFIQQSGLAVGAAIAAGGHSWLVRAATPQQKRLVVVFLRGAIDGLNIVVPYRETAYYEARPKIAIPQPGQPNGALKLTDTFGLHPALEDIYPFWQQGSLAFVHACGSPDETRSHFDAQDYMESGTPGLKKTPDGWMNRLLAVLAGRDSGRNSGRTERNLIQAVNVGATTPRILAGPLAIASLGSGRNAARPLPLDNTRISAAFDQLYRNKSAVAQAYQEGKLARQALLKDLDAETKRANNGAPLPYGFATDTQRLARVMRQDPRVQLAFLALGGWDTHVNQGSSQGQLARNLQSLGRGLATFQQELGPVYAQTTIVVMSEFGRTVAENGNGGTDHGHGNVMWMMGGPVKGAQVYGQFPGLQASQLHEGRDLAVTTDFRTAVGSLLTQHLQLSAAQSAQVFPGYSAPQTLPLIKTA